MYTIVSRYKNVFQIQMKYLLPDLMFPIKLFLNGETGIFSKMLPVARKRLNMPYPSWKPHW